ncbi:MAG: RdgB/HAM1 family non-canonical purine NTP pyrophosphatase [Candidatus Kapabacteria bacterium]|nr:RdgB/HAM1 family non-canonical purine NTP pyrophosphatase [Candidatus Kapabacteria bacterium]
MKLLLASNNKHKLKELLIILKNTNLSNIEIITPIILNSNIEVDETGSTFEENAKLKAIAFYNNFKIPTIADDSGLEIEALNNRPGVFSARYSGNYGDDKANRLKSLTDLANNTNRNAQFRTVICFYNGKDIVYFNGICKGQISNIEKGLNGFGYDSIFIPNNYTQTFAELDDNIKNKISHRAIAIEKFTFWLKSNNSSL